MKLHSAVPPPQILLPSAGGKLVLQIHDYNKKINSMERIFSKPNRLFAFSCTSFSALLLVSKARRSRTNLHFPKSKYLVYQMLYVLGIIPVRELYIAWRCKSIDYNESNPDSITNSPSFELLLLRIPAPKQAPTVQSQDSEISSFSIPKRHKFVKDARRYSIDLREAKMEV